MPKDEFGKPMNAEELKQFMESGLTVDSGLTEEKSTVIVAPQVIEERARLNVVPSTILVGPSDRLLSENQVKKTEKIKQVLRDKGMDSQQVLQALAMIENIIWGEPDPIVGPGPSEPVVSLITEPVVVESAPPLPIR